MKKQKNTVIADVKAIRAISGWSIREVEKRANLGQSTLNRIINDGRMPSDTVRSEVASLAQWVKSYKPMFEKLRRKSKSTSR